MRSMHIRSDASGRDQLVATEAKKEKCSTRKIFAKLFLTEHFLVDKTTFFPKNKKKGIYIYLWLEVLFNNHCIYQTLVM